jgi:hypothetical protein
LVKFLEDTPLRENTECILNSEYYIHVIDLQIAMKKNHLPPPPCKGCAGNTSCSDLDRRQVLQMLGSGLATSLPFMASNASAQATPLLLVDADAEKDFAPLRPSDLKVAKPLLAFPFDSQTGKPKNESRSNKLVLIRLPEDQMEATWPSCAWIPTIGRPSSLMHRPTKEPPKARPPNGTLCISMNAPTRKNPL